jgi:hypothetical protein
MQLDAIQIASQYNLPHILGAHVHENPYEHRSLRNGQSQLPRQLRVNGTRARWIEIESDRIDTACDGHIHILGPSQAAVLEFRE